MLLNLLQPLADHANKTASVFVKIRPVSSDNHEFLALVFGFLCLLIAAAILWRIEKQQSRAKMIRDQYHYPCEMDAACISAPQHYRPSLQQAAPSSSPRG